MIAIPLVIASLSGIAAAEPPNTSFAAAQQARPATAFPRPDAPEPIAAPESSHADALTNAMANLDRIEAWLAWCDLSGSSDSVLYGTPSPADRAAASACSAAVLSLIRATAKQIDEGIARADKTNASGASRPGIEALAARAIHARTVLLPLRAARAMLLSAAIEPDPDRRTRLANDAGALAAGAEPVAPWADAERSLLRALALLLQSDAAEKGNEAAAIAATGVKTINDPDTPPALRDELGDELGFTLVLASARTDPESALAALRTLALREPVRSRRDSRVVAAELRARLIAPGRDLASASATAFDGYLDAIEADKGPLGDTRSIDRLSAIVGARVAAPKAPTARAAWFLAALRRSLSPGTIERCAVDGSSSETGARERRVYLGVLASVAPPPADATSEVRIALAKGLLSLAASEPDTPESRAAGALALASLAPLPIGAVDGIGERAWQAAGPRPAGPFTFPSWSLDDLQFRRALSEPIAESIRTIARIESGTHASLAWAALLDRFQRDPAQMAGDRTQLLSVAAEARADAAKRLAGNSGFDVLAWADLDAEADAVQRSARGDAAAPSLPADRVSTKGRLAVGLALTDPQIVIAAMNDAPDGPARAEAAAMLIDRAWAKCAAAVGRFAITPCTPSESRAAAILALGAAFVDSLDAEPRRLARERTAWGMLLSGDAVNAARLFEASMAAGASRADLVRGLAEAHLAAGDDARAFARFRELVTATRPEGEFAADHFHAWARMLQILDRRAGTESEKEDLRRQVRRLRTLDPARACPPCAAAIDAIAASLGL